MASITLEYKAQLTTIREGSFDLPQFAAYPKPPTAGTYWRTVRYLRSSQIVWLAGQRLRRWVRLNPNPNAAQVGLRTFPQKQAFPEWQPAIARRMIETGRFSLLNVAGGDGKRIPWSNNELPRLWVYHLNYCDFLNLNLSRAEDRPILRKALLIMADWCEQNSTGQEAGWEPYPLSLRIVNWLKFFLRNGAGLDEFGEEVVISKLLASLRCQALLLERKLEFHLRANHLLKNIKALMFASALLETRECGRWWGKGTALLKEQLAEQILADGGHFERSPMYHAEVLEDLLDLQNLISACENPFPWRSLLSEKIRAMAEFLAAILHPDGEIPLLNDSVFGIARPTGELLSLAGRSQASSRNGDCEVRVLPETGYAVIRDGDSKSCLVFDCGPLGPNNQPGHGHCDALNYELSLCRQRLIVDTGVSTYELGAERHYERSTAAHNTLRIDGADQAEIWASFRVGRRPKVGRIEHGKVEGLHFVRGEHYGYKHLGAIHSRTVVHRPDGLWVIADLLSGKGNHKVESFMHFHPRVMLEPCGSGASCRQPESCRWTIRFGAHIYKLFLMGDFEAKLVNTWYAPEFGLRQSRLTLWQIRESQLPVSSVIVILPAKKLLPEIHLTSNSRAIEIDHISVPLVKAGH